MSEDNEKHAKQRPTKFARRLLAEWRSLALPSSDARVVVAVSGGADSAALLLACDESIKAGRLKVRLTVAHLDHMLRDEAGAEDASWVGELAARLGHGFVAGRVEVDELARAARENVEQAARVARYDFLGEVARASGAGVVLTGHTLDDQAETVLLRLLRGSGAQGLGGMRAVRRLDEQEPEVRLARPLLSWARRAETAAYCRARGIEARTDAWNEDERFARVRVRKQLLPLLESFNPRVVEALGRTAELLREDAAALDEEAWKLLTAARSETDAGDDVGAWTLRVDVLAGALRAVRRRALRVWIAAGRGSLRRLELAHVEGVERLLVGERGGRVAELPGGWAVERRGGRLSLRRATGGV